ncbi:transglycosylase SLT domain-containing protein, partial [bacterium]|nr:transglycosylase SLT domain-containing protein [bacterium]
GVLYFFRPARAVFEPVARIWSAGSLKEISAPGFRPAAYVSIAAVAGAPRETPGFLLPMLGVLGALFLLWRLQRLARDAYRLLSLRRSSFLLRRVGRVCVRASDHAAVAFSYRLPREAGIVVPTALVENRAHFRMAVAHEIQHHRQRDTHWVYGLWCLQTFSFGNPLAQLWARWICQLQEFACDETLVDRRKVESRAYARCLFEAANTAIGRETQLVCATGLLFSAERHTLKRRISRMLQTERVQRSMGMRWVFLTVALVASAAIASKDLIQDRRVTQAQAIEWAKAAQKDDGFKLLVNDSVVEQLNRLVGTPEGREFARLSLARMETHRPLVDAKLQEYGVPDAFRAVPLVESGYQNLPDRNQHGYGAGLWMFIVSTARHFGLQVDTKKDERLEPALETDAAMRYLKANYLRFQDWTLAVMAYNMGEQKLQTALQETGSRDGWALIGKGHEQDRGYVAKLVAMVILMRKPEILT